MWEWLPYCGVDATHTVNGLCVYSSLLVVGIAPFFFLLDWCLLISCAPFIKKGRDAIVSTFDKHLPHILPPAIHGYL